MATSSLANTELLGDHLRPLPTFKSKQNKHGPFSIF